jgi:EAL domain-containing protein (putative c-di-GMP-specific phosphodiesterase class I)
MKVLGSLKINYKLSFNLGIYPITDRSVPVASMFDRADLALQAAKGMYTRHWAVYDSQMRDEILSEQEIVSEMNDALNEKQFCIYLQPVYSAIGKHLVSAEALVRWKHPTKGMILPGLFIPIFEKNGFIIQLDRFIWEEACIYLDNLRKNGKPMIPISVNVSRVNLYSHDLVEFLTSLIAKYDLKPELLRLEITETAYTENPDQIIEVLPLLRKAGFTILMDDFGSGYSSLNMLKSIELDILKIDMRFVDDFASSSKSGNLITSIVRMAKWLDLKIIVEGVETKKQYDFLKSIGCDYIQGYYFSKAIPVVQFEDLLSSTQPFWTNNTPSEHDSLFDGGNVWSSDPRIEFIFDVVEGIGVYELSGGELSLIMANDSYYDIMHGDVQFVKKDLFDPLCDNDALVLNDAIERAVQTGETETVHVKKKLESGEIISLKARLKVISQNSYSVMLMFSLSEIIS